MSKTEYKREQIENEITKLYNVFFKDKFQHSYLNEYHYDIADVYFDLDYICIEFKNVTPHLHIDYTGRVVNDFNTLCSVDILNEQLKLLKRLIVSMI